MDRLLPDPRPVGYRRDGRRIFAVLGADPTDPSKQQLSTAPTAVLAVATVLTPAVEQER
ncbi:hypothetical protein [Streptomyces sp. NPDC001792]|uniref:hypothetical protein n=1 Tax=unclassified Streptomyces TaxID=2593676 RepID=UPI00332C0D0C